MQKQHTSPSIISAVLDGIRTIWRETPTKRSARSLPGINDAIRSQERIGWWALICGRWSHLWAKAQDTYFTAIKSPKSSKRWQANLIRLFWETSWDIWDQRNDIEHDTKNNNNRTYQQQLQKEITLQCNLGAPALFERQYFQKIIYYL